MARFIGNQNDILISKNSDFIGLSEEKESLKPVDGSIFYETDTKKNYIYYINNWFELALAQGSGSAESSKYKIVFTVQDSVLEGEDNDN